MWTRRKQLFPGAPFPAFRRFGKRGETMRKKKRAGCRDGREDRKETAGSGEPGRYIGRRDFLASLGRKIGYAGIGAAGLSALNPAELDAILAGLAGGGKGGSIGGGIGPGGPTVNGSFDSGSATKCLFSFKFNDGGNCDTPDKFECEDFICEGGAWNDFECEVPDGFHCSDIYYCVYSFDGSDCWYEGKDVFTCGKSNHRLSEYRDEDGGGPPGHPRDPKKPDPGKNVK